MDEGHEVTHSKQTAHTNCNAPLSSSRALCFVFNENEFCNQSIHKKHYLINVEKFRWKSKYVFHSKANLSCFSLCYKLWRYFHEEWGGRVKIIYCEKKAVILFCFHFAFIAALAVAAVLFICSFCYSDHTSLARR